MIAALQGRQPEKAVPLWEIHFHCWEKFAGRRFVSGKDFDQVPAGDRERILREDADIMLFVAEELGYSGVTVPDMPWNCPYTLPQDARLQLIRILREHSPDFLLLGGQGGVIAPPSNCERYLEFAYRLFDAPEEVDRMAQNAYEGGIERMKQHRDAGLDAIYIGADFADNRGPFFNPRQMERWILPRLAMLAEQGKSMGIHVMLHCDGNLHPVLEALSRTGICGLQAIDPTAGMDIRRAKEQAGGRMCLCGNVDCSILELGTPQDVYKNTKDILDSCKQGGGLILGASNAVVTTVPKENYRALIQAWRDHGAY